MLAEKVDTVLTYSPVTIDNSHIQLSDELIELIEELIEAIARNQHELWAKRKISEGPKHETPRLVRYEDLAESEKAYYRESASETLKMILALGGTVTSGHSHPSD